MELKRYEPAFWGDCHYMSIVGEDHAAGVDGEDFYIADEVDAALREAADILRDLGNLAECDTIDALPRAEAWLQRFDPGKPSAG